jgi:hypothetical protein
MSWKDRIELYDKIEAHRGRPLIVYVTSKRLGVPASMASDSLPVLIKQVDALPNDAKEVDLMIVSFGGDPMVAWRLISVLHQRVERIEVLIPQSAYSAATLVALGADKIFMHPYGHLGPVDMQIYNPAAEGFAKWFSTEDITAFIDFVRDTLKITDQQHIRALFEMTCKEITSLGIGYSARSSKLAVDLAERLLSRHMKDEEQKPKVRNIVESMSRKFQAHAYPISRSEAIAMQLPVDENRDEKLEQLMWSAWLDLEAELKEAEPFDIISELLKSSEASKLLAPVPQLDIPAPVTAGSNYQTSLQDIIDKTTNRVEPVDFEVTGVIVDSARLGYAFVTKGKILASRLPDLRIQYSLFVSSNTWDKQVRPAKPITETANPALAEPAPTEGQTSMNSMKIGNAAPGGVFPMDVSNPMPSQVRGTSGGTGSKPEPAPAQPAKQPDQPRPQNK